MNNKSNKIRYALVFVVMLLVIALLSAVAFTGADLVFFRIPSVEEGIKLGLDLRGGSILTYEAQADDVNADNIIIAISMLRERLNTMGYTESTIYQTGDKRITIEIPALTNPDEAVQTIGSTAELQFRDSTGKVWMTGTAVESATYGYGQISNSDTTYYHLVELAFRPEYRSVWTEATKAAANMADGENYIAIYMDDEQRYAPRVGSEFATTGLTGDSCVVTFGSDNASQAVAQEFANFVRIGQLPFELSVEQLSSVGPTLGANSLNTSLIAGGIGLLLIILFMLVFYRLPGMTAAISLLFYTALIAIILSIIGVNLSLPGIAGIILSIGMAVDANVIIFERIKDELRAGKTIRSAVDSGFKRALSSIIDSNITTLIAAVVLMIFGTGNIQGFAVTLLVGVLLSMFTVLCVSRLLLKQIVKFDVKSTFAFGLSRRHETPRIQESGFSFTKNFSRFGLVSAVISLVAVVALILTPFGVPVFNLDIDFVGGSSVQYDIGRSITNDDMNDIVDVITEITGTRPSAPQRANETGVIVKSTNFPAEQREEAFARLQEQFPDIVTLETNEVGQSFGRDLQRSALTSVTIAAVMILLYITIRFQFSSGLAAVIALLHDLLIMMAGYVIFRIPINMNFIAVLLTILGYSINSTIIIFDRIRDNRKLMQKSSFAEITDRSIKQTIIRNINTTLTTLLPVVCLIIIGVPSVRNFAIPLTIGMLAGAYSSICLSGSLWGKIRRNSKKDDRIEKSSEA